MLSRRRFLTASAVASALPIVSGLRAQAQPATASLPPAFAALANRKSEAVPITAQERESRFARAQQLMARDNIDAIALIGGTSLVYFTGVRWWNSERLFVAVLPRKGAPFYVCPSFEEERAREQMKQAPGGKDSRVYTWHEDENPYVLVAQGL